MSSWLLPPSACFRRLLCSIRITIGMQEFLKGFFIYHCDSYRQPMIKNGNPRRRFALYRVLSGWNNDPITFENNWLNDRSCTYSLEKVQRILWKMHFIIVMLLLYWSVKFMVLYWYSGLVIAGSEPNAEELETEHDRRRFQVHKISDTYCVV